MKTITGKWARIIVILIVLMMVFVALNLVLGLGFFGEHAKTVAAFVYVVGFVIARLLTPSVTRRNFFGGKDVQANSENKDAD
ncbi:MAG: hypothetical protein GC188_10925 [Alphaproteobacteria bacterium]|nr:hypothetical protein [Alphaproteobacteria bacterium]